MAKEVLSGASFFYAVSQKGDLAQNMVPNEGNVFGSLFIERKEGVYAQDEI